MEDTGSPPDGDSTTEPARDITLPEVVNIAKHGNVIIDATFENSKDTLRSARKERAKSTISRPSTIHHQGQPQKQQPTLKPRIRLAFRVDSELLKKQSKYFDKLLGDTRFREGRDVSEALAALTVRSVRPKDAEVADLPWVKIHDDDGATMYANREVIFEEMLRILHGVTQQTQQPQKVGQQAQEKTQEKVRQRQQPQKEQQQKQKKQQQQVEKPVQGHQQQGGAGAVSMSFITTLAVLADRFDCAAAVAKHIIAGGLKFKWPVTTRSVANGINNSSSNSVTNSNNSSGNSNPVAQISRADENVLRQKILVSWLLDMPVRFKAATRELIMNGSCQWGFFGSREERGKEETATWWYLQDGLEEELEYRRTRILRTIASVQNHFITLYTSSARRGSRQCKLGYDSSVSCDSFQLGEIFKFLSSRDLLFAADFSPDSVYGMPDTSRLPIESILATLRQCPSYQIDKNHTNCGLRTRLLPILDFLQALLSANSVPLTRAQWKDTSGRTAHAWLPGSEEDWEKENDEDARPFRFTRNLAGDQRFRFENAMGADKFAREVFTSTCWDWTADMDPQAAAVSTTPKWSFSK
ncbi:hypothetical protein F5Y16DRAFT_415588 [Xylariaceae sp. FL0255]|nr:hypothetical protein F5Y16DRAFT_415588 [Xylariaceae sp. FL0255]